MDNKIVSLGAQTKALIFTFYKFKQSENLHPIFLGHRA